MVNSYPQSQGKMVRDMFCFLSVSTDSHTHLLAEIKEDIGGAQWTEGP